MNEQIAEWMDAQAMLKIWKDKELKLRKQVLELCPTSLGTEHLLINGFELTITRGVSRKIELDELSLVLSSLSEEEKECVQYKPTLDARKYEKLPLNNILSRAVTVKPSLPSIKWKEIDVD